MTLIERSALAFAISPSIPGLLFLFLGTSSGNLLGAFAFAVVSIILGYVFVIPVALPIYCLATWRGFTGLRTYLFLATGLFLALMICFVFYPMSLHDGASGIESLFEINWALTVLLAVPSFVSVFCFWLIARPDLRDAE